jgi:hypothetical protein
MRVELTPKEAKELSLEVWRYLRDHPEITNKVSLPPAIRDKVIGFLFLCPLCPLFLDLKRSPEEVCSESCPGCPLDIKNCRNRESPYSKWSRTMKRGTRREAAAEIVSIIEAWEPEEDVT